MINLINALKAINYWETDPGFNFGFIRENYMDEIIRSSGNKLIKVVVGQRRTGKSYIIRQYIRYLINDKSIDPKNIFYLNLELFDFDEIKTANDLAGLINQYKQEVKPQGKGYIFIDEIQIRQGNGDGCRPCSRYIAGGIFGPGVSGFRAFTGESKTYRCGS